MNRLFTATQMFDIPDGTRLAPIFNPWDVNERDLPLDTLEGVSMAVGEIGDRTMVHIFPLVSQMTWVLAGRLEVRMKGVLHTEPYSLNAESGQGVLTEPMTYLQIVNRDPNRAARLLYVVTPAYIFEGPDGYDDSVFVDKTWDELSEMGFPVAHLDQAAIRFERDAAMERIRLSKTESASPTA